MVGKTQTGEKIAAARASDEALETGKLLVEFLHASYATRRQRAEAEAATETESVTRTGAKGAPSGRGQGVTARTPMSAHAVRAAIHVYQHVDRTVGQIASGLGISYGWASRVVEELEAAGYVVRERDEADRRIVHVRLDPGARGQVERAYAWRGEAVEQALEPFSESERAAIRLFLRRVIDLLREGDGAQS